MEESAHGQQSGMSKKTIALIIGLLLIIGGAIAAYVLLDKSTKEQYFTAEKDTMEYLSDRLIDKYELESDWAEKTSENPSRLEHRLQLVYDSTMSGGQYGGFDPFDIIANIALKLDFERDPEDEKASLAVGAELGTMDVGSIDLSLASHDLFVELPFTEDIIHISDQELNRLLHEADPMTFPEEDLIDFTDFFNYTAAILSEEDMEYVEDEYVKYVYELLPESAFSEESESVTVLGNDVKTDKLSFELSEDEVKDILTKVLEKAEKDKTLKDIIRELIETQMVTSQSMIYSPYENVDEHVDAMMAEFDEGIKLAIDEIDSLYIPDGFSSIIWVDDNHIVKRDLAFTIGPDEMSAASIDIQGEHQYEKDSHEHEVVVTLDDGFYPLTLEIEGEFNWDGEQGDDRIVLRAEGEEIVVETSEELTSKDTKEFTRSFMIANEVGLEWTGEASYSGEEMESSHQFLLIDQSNPDSITINLDKKGSIIKEVSIPEKSDAVLLGEMEPFEIEMYFEKLAGEFQNWTNNIMGGGGLFGF